MGFARLSTTQSGHFPRPHDENHLIPHRITSSTVSDISDRQRRKAVSGGRSARKLGMANTSESEIHRDSRLDKERGALVEITLARHPLQQREESSTRRAISVPAGALSANEPRRASRSDVSPAPGEMVSDTYIHSRLPPGGSLTHCERGHL